MVRNLLLAIVAALAVLAVVFGPRLMTLLEVGAGYTAKQMCSCLYVSERSGEACTRDLDAPADTLVQWTADEGRVRASALGLQHATARYEKGFGCVLEN